MGFDLFGFLKVALGGLNIPEIENKAATWLEERAVEFPDAREKTEALASFLSRTIEESESELDPLTMKATLYGIAADIVKGTTGTDPGAWQGGG